MFRELRFFIQKNCPWLYSILFKISYRIVSFKSRERRKRYGEKNADKTIYIIRVRQETLGLMGYYTAILGNIRIAEERNFVPVVDMMNYKNTYINSEQVGKINAWEYYFEPISAVSLQDAYQSRNVILGNLETPFEAKPRAFYDRVYKDGKMEQYYDYVKRYIRYNEKTEKILMEAYDTILRPIFEKGGKVLGVVSRGTDLIGFPGHSIQPSLQEAARLIAEYMEKYCCQYIFVASDSDSAIEYFRKQFGEEKVLSNACRRYDNFSSSNVFVLSEMHFDRENDEYQKGIEYLTTMHLLSNCNALFGSLVGSTMGAICMNCGAYEGVEIFDAGMYQ